MNFLNKEKISDNLYKLILPYLEKNLSIHSDNIISVLLYGNLTSKEHFSKKNKIKLLFVFKELNLEVLNKSLKLVKQGQKKGIVAPLCFSKRHIETSTDTFPVEFLDIKDNHILLYGEDFFSTLVIDKKNLRLRCEEQVKSIIIKLRQSYLEVGLSKKGIERMILNSFEIILPTLKGILTLKNIKVPRDIEGVIASIASIVDIKADTLLAIVKDVEGDEKIAGFEAHIFFNEYLIALGKIAEYVDALN